MDDLEKNLVESHLDFYRREGDRYEGKDYPHSDLADAAERGLSGAGYGVLRMGDHVKIVSEP